MSAQTDALERLAADPALHNRWKRLCGYESQNTAKMTASRLRKRYGAAGYLFKVVTEPGGYAVGVMYKSTDGDGRIP